MHNILVKPHVLNPSKIDEYIDSPKTLPLKDGSIEWVKGEPTVELINSETLPHDLFQASLEDIEVSLSDYGCGESFDRLYLYSLFSLPGNDVMIMIMIFFLMRPRADETSSNPNLKIEQRDDGLYSSARSSTEDRQSS